MHPQFFEASVTIILAIALATYTLAYGQRGRNRRLFIALLGSIVVWSGGVAASRVFADASAALLAARVSFVGIFALPPLWYALSLQLTRRNERGWRPARTIALFAPSVLACGVMATNHWHHLYIREPALVISRGPADWAGPLFWVWVPWAYLLVFGGSLHYLAWSWRLMTHDARWRGALVCVASMLPLGANVVHLVGVESIDHDLTPMLLGVATVLLFVGGWRFRLLDTLPVARRDVIEHLRDGVLVADSQGFILDMNPAAERMIEARLVDLVGHPVARAVAAQAADRFEFDEAAFNQTVIDMCSSARGFETEIQNYEGRYFEISGASVTDSLGQVSGLYIIMRDVTERSRFDEMQRESRRAQTIASLAAGISHEVNNPLSYVRANVRHVIDELGASPDKRIDSPIDLQDVLIEALEGIDRIGTIVERVRKFAHTRGSVRESIPIQSVFEEAARIRGRKPGPEIDIVVDVAPGLRPAIGFRDGLLEAILNLLDNALHALRETGGVVWLKARPHGQSIRIEVEDDGPGVPEALRERIFEPFFTTAPSEVGTGLGLAVTTKLVADFGGTLGYEPADGGGARFVIDLPQGPE